MSYSIHTTEGLVLSYRSLREADRVYSILTRDFGLIRATATGVRKGHSKLRGVIEPISLVQVSLVKGREYWRLTSAEFIQKVESSEEILKPLALLEKLVQGEAPNSELFEAVKKIITPPKPPLSKGRAKGGVDEMFEIKLVAQILFHLGYLREEGLNLEKKELIQAINHGLEASHLTNR